MKYTRKHRHCSRRASIGRGIGNMKQKSISVKLLLLLVLTIASEANAKNKLLMSDKCSNISHLITGSERVHKWSTDQAVPKKVNEDLSKKLGEFKNTCCGDKTKLSQAETKTICSDENYKAMSAAHAAAH